MSLRIRCNWGIRNALFHVAKEAGSDKVLGVAMWMPPKRADVPQAWGEWAWEKVEGWRLWGSQVVMNVRYGRGGLNVKVCGFSFVLPVVVSRYIPVISTVGF